MIYAVMTVRNEGDIIGDTVGHLLDEGVDQILVYDGMSTDDTRPILSKHDRVRVFDDTCSYHRQPLLTSELAQIAYDEGANWVLPVDADEFWVAPGTTLTERLDSQPADVGKLWVAMFQHHDRYQREVTAKPNPKVAFRAHPNPQVKNGNHDCVIAPGRAVHGQLEVREIQYRGFQHFMRKAAERNATIDPSLDSGEGVHHRRLDGMTVDELRVEWERMMAVETVWDPIPCRR